MDQIVSSGSVPVSSLESALQQKQAAGSSVRAKIAAIEGNLSGAANTSNMLKLDFERRFTATQNLKPLSLRVQSLKPAETQINTDTSGSSTPSHQKIMKCVSLTPTDAERIYYNRLESSKMLKPETRQQHEPSFPKVYHGTKLSVGKQNNSTKGQSFTGRNGWVENITSTKPLKPAKMQKPNYIRATAGAKNKLQRESKDPCIILNRLPDILGNPPSKPKRPPSVDIEKFRRNLKDRNYGGGMKTPPSIAAPPQRPCPSSDRAAVLSQQLDEDQSYENVGMRNPPPLPIQVHPSKRTEADLSEDIYEEPDDKWMEQAGKSKTHQERKSEKEDANQGKVTQEKQAEPKGTIRLQEMKDQGINANKEKKKNFKIKGPIHAMKKGKALFDFKGGKSDLSLNQDVYRNTESVPTGRDDLKKEETGPLINQTEADIYDDIGAPDGAYSGLGTQNFGKDDVYVYVDNPKTRVCPLPQATADGGDVYVDVVYEDDDYEEVCYDDLGEVCVYEMD